MYQLIICYLRQRRLCFWLCWFVSLLVCQQDYLQNIERIFMEFLRIRDDSDYDPDPDYDQNRTNLHEPNQDND